MRGRVVVTNVATTVSADGKTTRKTQFENMKTLTSLALTLLMLATASSAQADYMRPRIARHSTDQAANGRRKFPPKT